jgi:hypothetical protein
MPAGKTWYITIDVIDHSLDKASSFMEDFATSMGDRTELTTFLLKNLI